MNPLSTLSRTPRTAALAVAGVAAVAAVGGGTAWALTGKTVTVEVDGAPQKVSLHGGSVSDVLRAAHLTAGAHDQLTPAAGRSVSDGDTVALRHGRELRLVVDGVQRTVWVTAGSVDEALSQAGLRVEGAALSASRSRQIGLDGLSLDVRTPKDTSVAVDGGTRAQRTTAVTVGDLLGQLGVTVRPSDTVEPAVATAVSSGLVVRVTRHDVQQATEDAAVPFPTVRTPDGGALVGTERVAVAGRPGTDRRTFAVTLVDGAPTGRSLVGTVPTVQPVAQQVVFGTRPKPAPAPRPVAVVPAPRAAAPAPAPRAAAPAPRAAAPAPAPRAAVPAPPARTGGLNWAALARCESGGNPRAVGGGGKYFGLYQFSVSTWRSVGGSGNPADASPAEQTARAAVLYSRTGRSSWPVCGRQL